MFVPEVVKQGCQFISEVIMGAQGQMELDGFEACERRAVRLRQMLLRSPVAAGRSPSS